MNTNQLMNVLTSVKVNMDKSIDQCNIEELRKGLVRNRDVLEGVLSKLDCQSTISTSYELDEPDESDNSTRSNQHRNFFVTNCKKCYVELSKKINYSQGRGYCDECEFT